MIQFEKIRKSFKVDFWKSPNLVLDEVSFSISQGSTTGFLGSNGAGKTTLIKILMGLIKQDSGRIVLSNDIGDFKCYLKHIGYLPERPYFYPYLTGREFLFYLSRLSSVNRNDFKKSVMNWGEKLNILFALDRKITTYSKGMLQRLGLLSTLIHNPKLIILDEPLSGLDPIGRKEIKDVMIELNKMGKTIFFSSHIVPDVEEICNKIVFLNNKKIFYDGDLNSLSHKNLGLGTIIVFKIDRTILEKLNLESKIISKSENIYEIRVGEKEKDLILKNLISHNASIIKLDTEKKGLEEVFYHLKKENLL